MYEFNATEFLVRLAENNGGRLLGFAADSANKLKIFLSTNYSAYFEAAFERCSHVTTIFDRSKSIQLQSIYVRTYLDYQGKETSDQKLLEFINGIHATSEVRTFLVIGSGGTGKTLLLKWLFLRLIEGQSDRIPLYVELRGINYYSDINLLSFMYDTMIQRRGRASFDAFRSAVADGRFIFALDGLDEIQHDKRREIIRQIRHLQETHPGLLFIISSRPDEALRSWGYAHYFWVLPLKKNGTLALISKLPYKPAVKKAFRDDVASRLYEKHTSFLSNPLLINIMLLTYGDLGDVPAKMHIFYEQAFETLFFRHDTWKDVSFQRKHHCELSVNEFRDCLSSLCIASYKRSQHEFTTTSVLDLIKKAAEYERISVDANSFLKDADESVCILQLDGLMYKFAHRSFQEYFAAVFIARGPAIKLADLLDSIAPRRGDQVIPMALDMNRSLLEREWILPRLGSLPGLKGSYPHILAFANKMFGGLTYNH